MLQRQIIYKQLQELQRRQQLPELGDARNETYINQLSSLKQASGSQFPSAINGTPVHDSSQMFMVRSMQMMQHGGSAVVQELPNELALSQCQNNSTGPVGLSQLQFDISSYGTSSPNTDNNVDIYSHLHGPSNHSAQPLTKNNNGALVMPSMQSSAFGNSFLSPRYNFTSEQISMQHESSQPNQVNSFEQVPVQGFNNGILSGNYSPQGVTEQRDASLLESEGRYENAGWHGLSPEKVSKPGLSQPATSLDPLEQKILYNTDDNSWESSFVRSSNIGSGAFGSTMEHASFMDGYPSTQSGSWSALMQSAVAETPSSESGIQEEWSGVILQNPELSIDIQPSNFINSVTQKNTWVGINLQNSCSPSGKPELMFQNSNMNSTSPHFQQSGHQYLKQKEGFHPELSHACTQIPPRNSSQVTDYNFQQKHPTGGSQLLRTSPLPNIWPGLQKEHLKNDVHHPSFLSCTSGNQPQNNFTGHELRETTWLHGNTSPGIHKPFDQVNLLNIHRYSIESEKVASGNNSELVASGNNGELLASGNNGEPTPALLIASSDLRSQSMTAQTSKPMLDLLNNDDTSIDNSPGMLLNEKVSTRSELPLNETSIATFAKPCNISPTPPDPRTPQSNSFFPSLLKGNSSLKSPSSHNMNNHFENQHSPASPKPSQMPSNVPVLSVTASPDNSCQKNTDSTSLEYPVLENGRVTQPSVTLVSSQNVGFVTGLPALWPDMTTQQDVSSSKHLKFSNLFCSLDSAASILEASSGALNEQAGQNSFKQENNVQEFHASSGKSEYPEPRLRKGDSLPEGSSEMNISTSVSRYNHDQESFRKHHIEAGAVTSGLSMIHSLQLPSSTPEQIDNKTTAYPARDINVLGHSLGENYSLLHQVQSLRNADTDWANRLPINYNAVNYQQKIAKAKDLFLSGQRGGVTKGDSDEVSQFGAFSSVDNKGWDLQDDHRDQSGKVNLQNVQKLQMFGQNDSQSHSIGSDNASSATYQSQVSLQLAPSLFQHYGTMKNGQLFSTCDPKAVSNTVQQFSGMTLESSMWPSTAAATLVASRQLSPNMLPSSVTYKNLAVSVPKKRKIVALDMVPWHKEVNHGPFKLQNISVAELDWAQTSNRRHEEVKNETDIGEDVIPTFRAKRRLVLTTQLMQQVFRPPPAVILSADTHLNCDNVAYSAARLGFADTCGVNSNSEIPSDGNIMSRDNPRISKKTYICDFSKAVEGLINRVKRLEGDLLRMDKSLSIVDLKVESQELEKFSIINRFAKFHIRAHSSVVDHTSSSGTLTGQKTFPQRYVIALPMPKTVPEGTDCYSL